MTRSLFAALTLLVAPIAQTQEVSPDVLVNRVIHRRAVEAVIWGMPAVNFELMYQAMVQAKGQWNQVVYWSRLPDWKNQTLTPDPDTVYLMPFINTEDAGPVVLEIPPAVGGSITGSVDDAWQAALEDVGPAGADKGMGGKYVILPPDYTDELPEGYIALPSKTYANYALLRSNVASSKAADVAKAVAYGKRVKVYPLSMAAKPAATVFVDAVNVVFDSTIPYDLRFYRTLDRVVQREPWLERDKVMIDQLETIGIAKGKPFTPSPKTQDLLNKAVHEAHAWLNRSYETNYFPAPFYDGTHWSAPASQDVTEAMTTQFGNPERYPVDGRAVAYSMAYSSAKHLGDGRLYLMTFKDGDGRSLDGRSTYRLTVPPNAPVKLFWSATAYNRATHTLIRNKQWSSRSSLTSGLQKNADGSVPVYFGPEAPAGKDANWIPTDADGQFEVLFRFYGPEKSLLDKTWTLPDIEALK